MPPRQDKTNKRPFVSRNLRVFLFFILLSTVIWVLVQFSKTYQQKLRIPYELEDVPKNKILKSAPKTINIKMKENGFNLAWYSWTKSKISVPVDSLDLDGKNYIISHGLQRELLNEKLGLKEEDYHFLDPQLSIGFAEKQSKKIPVVPRLDLSYAPGYGAKDSLVISPDSIEVTGSVDSLKTISQVETEQLHLQQIKSDVSGRVELVKTSNDLAYFQKAVNYELKVDKFTEGRFKVPLELINVPEGWDIEIFPKTTVVVFKATLSDFKNISKSDFRVVCDFKKGFDSGNDFLVPELDIFPKEIFNERLSINRVDFIINK